MGLLVFPQAAANRITSASIGAVFPGQSVHQGLGGGVSVVTRVRSWAGSLSIAEVEPRAEPDVANEIIAFIGEFGTPNNTVELPIILPILGFVPLAVNRVQLGAAVIRPSGHRWYSMPARTDISVGQWGRIGTQLVQVVEVETDSVRLAPQTAFPQSSVLNSTQSILARISQEQNRPPITVAVPNRAGPWTLNWTQVIS